MVSPLPHACAPTDWQRGGIDQSGGRERVAQPLAGSQGGRATASRPFQREVVSSRPAPRMLRKLMVCFSVTLALGLC